MGLWISKMIVELMGGSITLDSQEGEGSRFTMKLKMKVARPESTQFSTNEQLKNTVTLLSHTITTIGGDSSMRQIVVMSDIFTVRLFKGCVEPLNFTVKHISENKDIVDLMQEQSKRCIIFDEEYT